MSGDARRFAPAAARNREPILDVLRAHLPASGTALEIASGSGEHAVAFAAAFPTLVWQPSDPDPANRESIAAWIAAAGAPNLLPPIDLDTTGEVWPLATADAVVCINMIHIAPWDACLGLMRGAARLLAPGGLLYLYGPFMRDGAHTAPSNAAFDESLRARDPAWGVRDLGEVSEAAQGFARPAVIAMPANNLSVLFRRTLNLN
jgi:SAM-dependent methyltransferase